MRSRVLAALLLPARIPDLIPHCNRILTAMEGNAFITNPSPALTIVAGHLGDLATAYAASLTRAAGSFEVRDGARLLVVSEMHQLKACVQKAADANPGKAAAIITGSGMSVIVRFSPRLQTFSLELGSISGQVLVYAPVVRDASYDWQTSTNEKDWTDLESTRCASTVVDGLAPLTEHAFRYRTLTRGGRSNWSASRKIFVL